MPNNHVMYGLRPKLGVLVYLAHEALFLFWGGVLFPWRISYLERTNNIMNTTGEQTA